MSYAPYSLYTLDQFTGQELGVSEWFTVDQAHIDQFADCTEDHQWIHVDRERAASESPYGTTIAHGFLTLSLMPRLRRDINLIPDGVAHTLNYGLDRVRFLNPVKAGTRIRLRATLVSATDKGGGRKLIKVSNTIEIEHEEKPALVAEVLLLLIGVP